jgi:hypothetical protein
LTGGRRCFTSPDFDTYSLLRRGFSNLNVRMLAEWAVLKAIIDDLDCPSIDQQLT